MESRIDFSGRHDAEGYEKLARKAAAAVYRLKQRGSPRSCWIRFEDEVNHWERKATEARARHGA